MASTDGVLFDYGRTLVTFTPYPGKRLLRVINDFRPRIGAALGTDAPDADSILRQVLMPLESYVESTSEDEVDYIAVYREAWLRAGMHLPDQLLYEILDAEQLVWDHSLKVDPEAIPVLTLLGELGVKRGICSNAPFPPAMMRRQMATNGVAEVVNAIVLSSEVRRRKPAPELYRAALEAIGTRPERTLFVGDRTREDYEGPRAIGMRAVIVTAHAGDPPPDGVPRIRTLADVTSLL